ncbi:unnamed protein product [Victoria cruziana]
MEFSVSAHGPTPLVASSVVGLPRRRPLLVSLNINTSALCNRQLHRRRHCVCRSSLSSDSRDDETSENDTNWSGFLYSVYRGSQRFFNSFPDRLKKEIGFDMDRVSTQMESLTVGVDEALTRGQAELDKLRFNLFPRFLEWNQWENWKDLRNWSPRRIGILMLYVFVAAFSFHKTYLALRLLDGHQKRRQSAEAYMEALIPEPSEVNIRKFKKSMWRKTMPKGLIIKKYIEGPDGMLLHDNAYVGERAWEDEPEASPGTIAEVIDSETNMKAEEKVKLKEELCIGNDKNRQSTWRERLGKWKKVVENEKLSEQISSSSAQFVVDFDMQEVKKSLREEAAERASVSQGGRALWISKRWWLYRPKLPYMFFLDKLNSSEVASIVFTEDLKKIYTTMKEGFPLEYVVDIPLDPHLFEMISYSGVEVDLLQKTQLHYLIRVVIALVPGLLILWLIREAMMLLHITSQRFLYKKHRQLQDLAYAENFILPIEGTDEMKSMYREVILGGDVWDLLDELMIYMGDPLQYYEKEVKFVRGVLLSGPPGTGKTLFARTLAKESGLPFVFASGAEFNDSERSGAAKINEIFSMARRNAPSFIFIDEIDAIAGPHARKDPRRRATFQALLSQLDGEKEKTGVDRFSLRQAVIFICATNQPDQLDSDFVRPGRIDRRLYIGMPDAKQRMEIFGVHSAGKKFSGDVDFEKLVFRTVGYSGADIRNLVNEAAIMSVRKGRPAITQQDIIDVLDKQLLEGKGVLLTEEEQQKCEESVSVDKKKLLAVHEAGHVLLAHLFPRYDWHASSQLLPGGQEKSESLFYPREDMIDQGYTTFGYMKMQMIVAHGGRCAEQIVFGDVTDYGQDDLEKITRIAREMVISPRNTKLGLVQLTKRFHITDRPDSHDGQLIKYRWDDPHVVPVDMTYELSELFTRELARYVEETEEIAMCGLQKNKHILDRIAKELLERSKLTGLEVDEMMEDMNPEMFDDLIMPYQINLEEEGPLPKNDKLRYEPLVIYPAPLHRC